MIVSAFPGRMQKATWNIERLPPETCGPSCVKSFFWIYKMKPNSENHETWRHNKLSHVDAMIKISKNSESVVTSAAQNPHRRASLLCRGLGPRQRWTLTEGVSLPRARPSAKKPLLKVALCRGLALGKDVLCRVSEIRPSAKQKTLGSVAVSSSVLYLLFSFGWVS